MHPIFSECSERKMDSASSSSSIPVVPVEQQQCYQVDEEEGEEDDEYAQLTRRCSVVLKPSGGSQLKLPFKLPSGRNSPSAVLVSSQSELCLPSSPSDECQILIESMATTSPPPTPPTAPIESLQSHTATLLVNLPEQSPVIPDPPPQPPPIRHPARIASCISVHSTVSISSTDSSLCDYPPNTPICKFCHQRAKANDPLISPCYCKGTIRYMHCRCLMKWLDKLKKRNSRHQPLSCEICNYEYRWRKRFKPCKDWQLPPCVGNDRQWHTVFAICAVLMVISMINLIIFGEEDGRHKSTRASLASSSNSDSFATIRVSTGVKNNQDPFSSKAHKTFLDNLFVKNSSSSGGSSGTPNTFYILASNGTVNATQLWHNLSAAFPSFQNINLIPNRTQQKAGEKSGPGGGGGGDTDQSVQIYQKPQHSLGHSFRSSSTGEAYRRRKNFPTKPSEVILVISGCLFFITFFMGTFAQIKSQVSFYTMMVRFVHFNQQWIIEEYNPDEYSDANAASAGSDTLASTPNSVKTSNTDLINERKQVIDL